MAKASILSLAAISVRGVVQGVGFRPFVYQLATRHNLRGWVRNTSGDVRLEVEGEASAIELFHRELETQAPPQARINEIDFAWGTPAGHDKFSILASQAEADKYQLVSPDIATCPDCLGEILNPTDRRHGYPFTNCTNCGPRFTIIEDIPYDRPLTTMRAFQMCPRCQKEYEDPADRRFHAQPNACPICGPRLELTDNKGEPVACDDIIAKTAELLKAGKIVAVKGLGGFLLAGDATSENAVKTLRERKHRPAKPLAIMVTSLKEARRCCDVNNEEAKLLESPASPIVLLGWKPGTDIAPAVAPGLKYLGLMLPYTPLHHLLLRKVERPLVMTSGNISEEPIIKDNDEALSRLGNIADYFLMHNRDIYARYDDSVTVVNDGQPQVVRRARGYAPYPIHLSHNTKQVLACGAEEKNTFCLTRDSFAFVSQHIGDMENLETLEHFKNTITLYEKLFRIEPEIIACDMHPEYLPTKYAKELAAAKGLGLVQVQHHHAHIAACLAENGSDGPVIGVSMDGTGYGPDGHIWGGELLVADCRVYRRVAHLEYLPLPGGALAVRKPYRTALGYLTALGIAHDKLTFADDIDPAEIEIIREQVAKGINTPLTSSMGRLFDAVAAMTGIRPVIQYDAQAAIDLEMAAYDAPGEAGRYPCTVEDSDGVRVVRLHETLAAVAADLQRGVSKAKIAMRFHNGIAAIILELCKAIAADTGLKTAALSGGVFQNRLLLGKAVRGLEEAGLEVLTHRQVPCNDGGISLGQAAIAGMASEETA